MRTDRHLVRHRVLTHREARLAWEEHRLDRARLQDVHRRVRHLHDLEEDAAEGPDVLRLVVLFLQEDDFGGTIIPSTDVVGDATLALGDDLCYLGYFLEE